MVGCVMAILQQLTGINFIMFYSNTLFASSGMSAQTITGLVGVVNFLSTFGGLFLLTIAGRRTIMVSCSIIMSIILLLNGWSDLNGHDTFGIVTTMLFIAFFEFSSGPITWLYMAEIMQDKAVSLATVLNWIINLIISVITPSLIKAIGDENVGWIFIVMGGFTVAGTIFIIAFMKETRGKTAAEIEEMFMGGDGYSEKHMKRQLVAEKDSQF
uniref:Hexose transporter 1 n=1 Tax=Strombidium inclinatum TaxID=197538 RepID=A0A7S3IJ38_9SPIT|mmetsp:Transcript_19971/g.30717  ORF Transcript_19971/g.30717 Transcript_19971/m.30717 type:complete len:213 (+) Transcript_19971:910-1548(+)|eukprot:CAMPEP_0170482506 /NCGR_PEP_ID=MMETSP0208-20121228/2494_1 /TAXON_ID=197538 /ORGANISM="Strombidium inclinatum, Strain S3" /LENGTH=212 /DNA_ID=CAMNT_0010755353 /DNA_START=911 /DNA_END=1549 /DNA_ORIENTATION=-